LCVRITAQVAFNLIEEWTVTGGTEGGGGKISSGHNTRWGREEVESMLSQRRWTDTDGTGVRAQLLAQKQIHQLESQALDGPALHSQNWRHPLLRLAAIWAVWRRLWRS
jgi:hypothetical protein